MTDLEFTAFVDALAEGRRPPSLSVRSDDLSVVRVAVELAAGRPGEGNADQALLDRTFHELSGDVPPEEPVRPVSRSRLRVGLLVAAMAAMVAGSIAVVAQTATRAGGPPQHAAIARTAEIGTFRAADHAVEGTIVVTQGPPAWVFMAVNAAGHDGVVICQLQDRSGDVVAMASLPLHQGTVVWNRSLPVPGARVSRATLLMPGGKVLAVAAFA